MRLNSSAPADRHPVLRQHLPDFRVYLKSKGYSADTIRVYLICLRSLDRAAAVEGLDLLQLAERYASGLPLVASAVKLSTAGFPAFLTFLAKRKLLVPRGRDAQIAHIMSRFRHYMRQEAGLSEATITLHGRVAIRFLRYRFNGDAVDTREITAKDVVAFLSLPKHHLKYIAVGLKALLRYLYIKGQIARPLANGIPAIRRRYKQRLPRSMKPEQLETFLDGLPVGTARERRNKTMIVLLARLGLRLGEVLRLTLDDIDWDNANILVRGKGKLLDRMPLPQDAGRMLFAYITQDRPESDSRVVFLRDRAPYTAIARTSLPLALRDLLKAAGIENTRNTGSRIFRHTFGTRILNNGVPIAEVANAMRHRTLRTTMIYARTDLNRLRVVARPWPVTDGKRRE
jgi:site-specific recombinase XerD